MLVWPNFKNFLHNRQHAQGSRNFNNCLRQLHFSFEMVFTFHHNRRSHSDSRIRQQNFKIGLGNHSCCRGHSNSHINEVNFILFLQIFYDLISFHALAAVSIFPSVGSITYQIGSLRWGTGLGTGLGRLVMVLLTIHVNEFPYERKLKCLFENLQIQLVTLDGKSKHCQFTIFTWQFNQSLPWISDIYIFSPATTGTLIARSWTRWHTIVPPRLD